MSNSIKGFCLFFDQVDALDDLKPADAWAVVRAIAEYHRSGADPVAAVPKSLKTVVKLIFQQIKRKEAESAAKAEGARITNEKRANAERPHSERLPNAERPQKRATDTDTITETIKKEPLSKERGKKESAPRFLPPTLKEVEEYCKSRNSSVDPKAFWEYFNEGKWKDAKGQPVRNWKQKLLTWEKYDAPTKQTKKADPKESSFDTDDFFEASLKRSYANEVVKTDTSDAALLSALKASVGVTA